MKDGNWMVVVEQDGLLQKHYAGPDKRKARETASKLLRAAKEKDDKRQRESYVVHVFKVNQVTPLTIADLDVVLPTTVF